MISPGCDIISVFFRCPVAEPIRENLIPNRFVYPCRCAIDICRVHPGYNKTLLHTAIHPELFFCQETILKIIPDFLFRPQLERLAHEECWVIYLTASNRIIERQRVSQGGVTATVVDHRLIVKRALELLATQLILIHNHPSGAAEASAQDRLLTEKVARAAALFDIRLLDHLIISREGDFSFLRAGLLR